MKNIKLYSLALLVPFFLEVNNQQPPSINPPVSYEAFEKHFGDIKKENYQEQNDYFNALIDRMEKLKEEGIIQKNNQSDEYSEYIGYCIIMLILIASGYTLIL